MRVRVVAGFGLVVILLALILFAPPIAIAAAVSLISALAVSEILWTTGFVREKRLIVYALVFSAFVPLWVFFESPESLAVFFLFFYVFVLFLEALSGAKGVTFEKLSGVFFASVIIPFFLASILRLTRMDFGKFNVLMMFIAAFGCDAAALLVGLALGKHKLAPDISPKKTVEGLVGGLVITPLLLMIYGLIVETTFGLEANYALLAVYGLAGAFVSQMGDLSMSFVKRQFHIKDFGNIIPGHGGILDRFDSVLFAAPLIETLLLIAPVFSL